MKRDPSGYWKMLGIKGDVEGHPFRGNQYTDVAGSGADDESRIEGHAALRYSDDRPTMTAAEMAVSDKARKHLYQVGLSALNLEEYAYSIEEGGSTVQLGGEMGVVSIDESDMRRMKHFIHTHPNETTFSSDDLYTFSSFDNVRSAEVITKGGTVYRIDKKDGATFPMGFASKIKMEWHEEMRNLSKKYGSLHMEGMPLSVAFERQVGETMDRLMDKHKDKFTYTTTELYYPSGKSSIPDKVPAAKGKKIVIDDREIIPPPDYYDKKGDAA